FVVFFSQPNRPPVASDGRLTTAEDTAGTGTLTASDPDGNALTFAVVTGPAHGALHLDAATGAYTYTPGANYNGADSFTFKANAREAAATAATVGAPVTPAKAPPARAADSYSTAEDTPLTVAAPGVLGNDSDVDGDVLTVAVVSGPAHGTLTLSP